MNPQVGFLLNKSLESLRNSNLESAELYLKQALKIQSNNPHVLRLLGVVYAQRREYSDALEYLNDSLKALPKNSLALSNLGNVYLGLKEYENALDAYDKSIKIDPKYEEVWSNKGNALYELKRYDEAIFHHDKALSLKPDYAEAWSNKGNTLNELKRFDEAIAHYDKALSLRPDYHEAWSNKGVTLHELKRFDEAIAHYDKSLSLKPDYAEAWSFKGMTLHALKRYNEAIAHYDKALSFKPYEASFFYQKSFTNIALNQYALAIENLEDAIKYKFSPAGYVEYILSALKPEIGLKPMPKSYVVDLFDSYANSFDKHLIDALKYETPKNLLELLNPSINDKFAILDIGCGTGLMGKLLKPYASKIVGVDLSKEMLSKAELTGVYDELIADDILEFVSKCNDKFDLVVSADVFIYIGELSNVFMDLAEIIKAGGLFCFSVEKHESINFALSPRTLRYSHSKEYIQQLASLNNFTIQNVLEGPIRQESHVDVDGYCFLLKKSY
jgi:predicted TPR repeat methyltransferase